MSTEILVPDQLLDSLIEQGKLEEQRGNHRGSCLHYAKGLQRIPNSLPLVLGLARSMEKLNQIPGALGLYRWGAGQDPHREDCLLPLVSLLRRAGAHEEIVARCAEVNLDTFTNEGRFQIRFELACALQSMGQYQQACRIYEELLQIRPMVPGVWGNLGLAKIFMGESEAASQLLKIAVQKMPGNTRLWVVLGNSQLVLDEPGEAQKSYEQATALDPGFYEAWNNLGTALRCQGLPSAATSAHQKALDLQPQSAEALNNLALAEKHRGEMKLAIPYFLQALKLAPENNVLHGNYLLSLNYSEDCSTKELFEAHRKWGAQFDKILPLRCGNDRAGKKPVCGGSRWRIGFVSPDFRMHSLAHLLVPLFETLSREKFEVFAYSEMPKGDQITERLRETGTEWRSTWGKSDADAIQMIFADQIDLLIDLAGHTARNRLPIFASHPAVFQASLWGYGTTTGLSAIDWRLTDETVDPLTTREQYCETLIRIPNGSFVFQSLGQTPEPEERTRSGSVTLGSFNQLAKLSDKTIDLWSRVLVEIAGTKLLLKTKALGEEATRESVLEKFGSRGVPADRILFASATADRESHLRAYASLDVALDPLAYNGAMTTCEALWMGVPVVTLSGDRYVRRMTSGILTQVGHSEWIARSEQEYLELVRDLVEDHERRSKLRMNLRTEIHESSLGNAARFVSSLEEVLLKSLEEG